MSIFNRVKTWKQTMTGQAVDYELTNLTTVLNNRFISLPNRQSFDSAAPTSGSWQVGDIVWNNNPNSNGFVGWVNVISGAPGTWMVFGSLNADPTGTILDYGGTSAPTGYLTCDGSAVSRTTYANLFTAIGTTWGSGDGSTTFNVPDLRGRVSIGSGQGSGLTNRTVAQTTGEETHVLSSGELASHTHTATVTDNGHQHTEPRTYDGARLNFGSDGSSSNNVQQPVSGTSSGVALGMVKTNTTGITVSNSSTGSGTAHNTMQPSAVVMKIIKT